MLHGCNMGFTGTHGGGTCMFQVFSYMGFTNILNGFYTGLAKLFDGCYRVLHGFKGILQGFKRVITGGVNGVLHECNRSVTEQMLQNCVYLPDNFLVLSHNFLSTVQVPSEYIPSFFQVLSWYFLSTFFTNSALWAELV